MTTLKTATCSRCCSKAIRAGGKEIPAIVVTGNPAAGLERDFDAGSRLLRKPFAMSTLTKLASAALKVHSCR